MRLVRNVVIVIVIAVLLLFGGRWVYNKIAHRAPVLPAKTTAAAPTPVLPTAIPSTPVPPTPVPPTPVPTTVAVTSGCSSIPDYDRPIQPQIGHPSMYVETGVNPNEVCWSGTIKSGFTAIIGGYSVDGVTNGVYKAVKGPKDFAVKVKDGFLAVCVDEVAEQEYCFRLSQAFQYNWAHAHIEPLPGWNCFPAPATTPTAASVCTRQPTGVKGTLPFPIGAKVVGFRIVLSDGRKCEGDCYLPSAPVAGSVTDGVICPWDTETAGKKPWAP